MTRLLPRLSGQFIALALLALGQPALADDKNFDPIEMPLEELVQLRILSTPKFAENPDAIPAVISVLTREDIRTYGWRTLSDALRTLQGFNVTSDHVYQYAGVRGISTPSDYRLRLRLLIDGMSINENIYGSAPTDASFPLDLDLVERIEVIRGPSASVYGGDAMFGVINLVTRSGESLKGSEFAMGLGSGLQRTGRATWGGRLENGVDLLISATGEDKQGQGINFGRDPASGTVDTMRHLDGSDSTKLFLRARGDDWRLSLVHGERRKVVPTGSYGTIVNDDGHVESDIYNLGEIAKEWRFDSRTSLQQRLYFGQYDYRALFPYDFSGLRVLNRDVGHNHWWGMDHHLVTRQDTHRWTLGIEYRADTHADLLNEDLGYGCYGVGNAPCLAKNHDSRQSTIFAQDEIQLDARNLLTAGLRYDRHNEFGGFWSPRLGLVHDAGDAGLLKALFGTAYRTPTPYERYYANPFYAYGNPDLLSEKVRSIELGWEKRFGNSGRLSAAVYRLEIQRMISMDLTGVAINGANIHADGLEIEVERRWTNGSHVRTNYSVQHADSESGPQDNSPRHMLKFNGAIPAGLPGLTAGFEAQWISARLAANGQARVSPYTLANLNLRYVPPGQRHWELGLGVYNLFDERYSDPAKFEPINGVNRWAAPQLPRTTLLKLIVAF